jgi:hypothetical protein
MKLIFTVISLVFISIQGYGQEASNFNANHPDVHKIIVKEVIQTTSYTYLNTEQNGKLQWVAVPKMEAEPGEKYYFQGGMEMVDFKSKELNRTFASVLFLSGLVSPDIVESGKTVTAQPAKVSKTQDTKLDITISPAADGITIEELFSNKQKYAGKSVKIRGKVTKYNPGIMGRNWFHLQDGTIGSGGFDLTVTSAVEVKEGDIVTVEGTISLDRDFGAGYFYPVILEDGRVGR